VNTITPFYTADYRDEFAFGLPDFPLIIRPIHGHPNWAATRHAESHRFDRRGRNGRCLSKFQISANGGAQPRWNKNGKEIFYVSLDSKMMAVPVKVSPDGKSLEAGAPSALFLVRIAGGPLAPPVKQQYAVSSDGQRLLVNLAADEGTTPPITLIYNWHPQAPK
jgi:hypothetical protein